MEIKVPDLGVDSAEVSEIYVAVGDVIAKNDNIILLESDKASVEVPSTQAGTITNILVSVGDKVSEGVGLFEVELNNSSAETTAETTDSSNHPNQRSDNSTENSPKEVGSKEVGSKEEQKEQVADRHQGNAQASKNLEDAQVKNNRVESLALESTLTYALPDLGVEEAQVAEVMVAEGDSVQSEQSLLLIESDKASVEVPAPIAGQVVKILVKSGDTVVNGQDYIVIASVNSNSEPSAATPSHANISEINTTTATNNPTKTTTVSKEADQHPQTDNTQRNLPKLTENEVNTKLVDIYAGPAVRKLARQLGVDITMVKGSALNNRILKEDLFAYVKSQIGQSTAPSSRTTHESRNGLPTLPDMSRIEIWGETDTVKLSRLQKVSIPQLNYNTYLPQVTQFDLADITDTESLRGELKGDFKKQGIGLTILAFIVKATSHALTQHPRFNSHLSDDHTHIIVRKSINMGIAVATDDGLIVPVIKDTQNKGIKQLAIEIKQLADKARDKKLSAKELQGASFTISSQGSLGGTNFTPLVNWPQVGILGVSEASMQPRWNEQQQSFEPRLMLPISLSYDHRVINGADAAIFTRYVATLLADPRRILL